MEDVKEIIKDYIFVFIIFFHDLIGVLDHSFNWESLILFIFFH